MGQSGTGCFEGLRSSWVTRGPSRELRPGEPVWRLLSDGDMVPGVYVRRAGDDVALVRETRSGTQYSLVVALDALQPMRENDALGDGSA